MALLPLSSGDLAKVPDLLERHLIRNNVDQLWNSIEPRRYRRSLHPYCLALAVIGAFFLRLSGLRQIIAHYYSILGISSISTLSDALSNSRFAQFLQRAVETLEGTESWENLGERDLVAVDTTWFSLPLTQRWKGLGKIASDAVGLGAMVALRLDGGSFPLRVLDVFHAATNDTKPIRFCRLQPAGPTYVMDRGFYSMKTVAHLLANGVRFIVRARGFNLQFVVKSVVSAPRRVGTLMILEDAIVVLGAEKSRSMRSRVRLVRARRGDGDELILITGHFDWKAEELLAAYKRRWEIEDFFLFLKEQLGMAHLYGFSATAMESLVRLALLGIGLLLQSEQEAGEGVKGTVAARLRKALKRVRKKLGVPPPWKPNTTRKWRKKKRGSRPRHQLMGGVP